MDRERTLADKYDVLDLKDLETYDPGSWIIQSSSNNQSMRNRRRSKSPPEDSLNSLWDNFDNDNEDNEATTEDQSYNNSILLKTLSTPSSVQNRAKHL